MSQSQSNDADASGVDLHQILLEIDEEVRAKRASGELSADMERELDMIFARFAPAGALEGDFEQLLARAEQQSFIDLLAPNESARKGVPQVKRVVQKSIRWYVRYVVEQFTGFAHTITKAVSKLSDRVDSVDQLTISSDDLAALPLPVLDSKWHPALAKAMADMPGRVLHARCGKGQLVKALGAAGIDAYGVDPDATLVAASGDIADLRPDSEAAHLRLLNPGVLGGLVLSGSIDILPVGAKVALIDAAATSLASNGCLAMVVAVPQRWSETQPVLADLAPGRPLHVATWQHLLADRGFTPQHVETDLESGTALIISRR